LWTNEQVERCRGQFPALRRELDGQPVVFFDGPAGTQVPQSVIDAVGHYYVHNNANHGGLFATSRESDALLNSAHRVMADLLGAEDPDTTHFGPNMTTLTFALSRALSRTWKAGDEVIVTRLDHDANVTPWVLAARDAGATVRFVEIHREDCTLDLDDFRSKISDRTRLVAVGCASNSVGTVNPVAEICRWTREVGALSFLDAVHLAPHASIDVESLGCDFLTCSAYKFFGPHLGVMWGRRQVLEELSAYKVRPAPESLPGKWMTGTQNHEGIAGALAAVEYLADIGRRHAANPSLEGRAALRAAFAAIADHERDLFARLLAGLAELRDVTIWGIADPSRSAERLPTVSITHARRRPAELAEYLGRRGIFVWHGNYYALQLTETLGLEPDGMVRIGLVHYNTTAEVDRLLDAMAAPSAR
jgi:cysteine desulfurase family protein (TIGR01976 family)